VCRMCLSRLENSVVPRGPHYERRPTGDVD
jgi:hypothetical protein